MSQLCWLGKRSVQVRDLFRQAMPEHTVRGVVGSQAAVPWRTGEILACAEGLEAVGRPVPEVEGPRLVPLEGVASAGDVSKVQFRAAMDRGPGGVEIPVPDPGGVAMYTALISGSASSASTSS